MGAVGAVEIGSEGGGFEDGEEGEGFFGVKEGGFAEGGKEGLPEGGLLKRDLHDRDIVTQNVGGGELRGDLGFDWGFCLTK